MRVITVGTECSGIDAPIEALRQLGVKFRYMFASEIDARAISVIRANHAPEVLHNDMTSRDVKSMPAVDLYVCGFPCQAYSGMNSFKKENDVRKQPLYAAVSYIRTHRPAMFILENVRRFQSTPEYAALMSPSGRGGASVMLKGYDVQARVLTPVEFNSPQSRQRVFIVGVRNGARVTWPRPVPLTLSLLSDIVDERVVGGSPELAPCYHRMLKAWGVPPRIRGVIDLNVVSRRFGHTTAEGIGTARRIERDSLGAIVHADVSPCLVSHAPGLYLPHLRRFVSKNELLSIQGFQKLRLPSELTHQNVVKLTGNSMSVPVLKAIMRANFPAVFASS